MCGIGQGWMLGGQNRYRIGMKQMQDRGNKDTNMEEKDTRIEVEQIRDRVVLDT